MSLAVSRYDVPCTPLHALSERELQLALRGGKKFLFSKFSNFELELTGMSTGRAWDMGISGARRARALLARTAAAPSLASRANVRSGETFLFEVSRAIASGFAATLQLNPG